MKQQNTVERLLPALSCPVCGELLRARPGRRVRPATWRDCLRRCTDCRAGYSNARTGPTVLFDDPRMNVPAEVRGGVLDTLAQALNVRNRREKRIKFGFSTSEDALTWTVFTHLHDSAQLVEALRRAGLALPAVASRP